MCPDSYFGTPTGSERLLYAKYWQRKLSHTKEINFPDSLAKQFVDKTKGFSYAYMKEAL
jgi:hypothetical protein